MYIIHSKHGTYTQNENYKSWDLVLKWFILDSGIAGPCNSTEKPTVWEKTELQTAVL